MTHPRRNQPRQSATHDYDHDIIAPDGVKTAIEAANAFEVLGGAHPRLSLTRADYEALPKAVNAGYPNKPVAPGLIWRVDDRGERYIGHALECTEGGVSSVEWFDVTISDA